jgi:hypothetical protein
LEKQLNIPKVFFSFLAASFLMWLLINLSKQYTTAITYQVQYDALAQNKILQQEPLKEIELLIKGSGFELLSENFSRRKVLLKADKLKTKNKTDYFFLPINQKKAIQKQLRSGLILEGVLKDTIYLKLGSLESKKVPVKPNVNIHYQLGYDLAKPLETNPKTVTISGPELQLEKIEYITTNLLEIEDVSEDVEKELTLILPNTSDKIKMSHSKVMLKVQVDKFTEGEVEIPIQVVNQPYGVEFNTFPKKVKVIFKVGLKDFNKITEDSFKIVCDYKLAKSKELNYMVPRLMAKPDIISTVRIVPDKIDFLIYK